MVSLLHEDATMMMPPYPLWMVGADEYGKWLRGGGAGCRGSVLRPVAANGAPAFAQWRVGPDGGYDAWSIHMLEISDGRITGINFFVDPDAVRACSACPCTSTPNSSASPDQVEQVDELAARVPELDRDSRPRAA